MMICAADSFTEQADPPTREAIELQRREQMNALLAIRRSLASLALPTDLARVVRVR